MLNNNQSSEPPNQLITLCRWCAYISGIVCIFGIFFIIIFYTFYLSTGVGYGFGELNDVAVIVQYTLMVPLTLLFYKILRSNGSKLSLFSLLVGIIGIIVVIFLQIILVIGLIPFSEQVGMVSIAFLVVLVWFIINRILDKNNHILPKSMFLNVMAGLYFGYPIWAFKVAKKLNAV